MIGKVVLLPFRLLGTSSGLIFNILKLIFSLLFGIVKFIFKNSIGVIIGLVAGVFIVKKQLDTDSDCCCGESGKEETVE
jgi:hypothetical protein